LAVQSRSRFTVIQFNKKILRLFKLLAQIGCVTYYCHNVQNSQRRLLVFSPFYFKKMTFYKTVKLVSTPSKKFTLTLKALKILNKSLKNSFLILETSGGLITHKEALKLRLGGYILCIMF
jgi:ribosomal protein S8